MTRLPVAPFEQFTQLPMQEQRNRLKMYIQQAVQTNPICKQYCVSDGVGTEYYTVICQLPYNLYLVLQNGVYKLTTGKRDSYGYPVYDTPYSHFYPHKKPMFRKKVESPDGDFVLELHTYLKSRKMI